MPSFKIYYGLVYDESVYAHSIIQCEETKGTKSIVDRDDNNVPSGGKVSARVHRARSGHEGTPMNPKHYGLETRL